MEVVKSWYTHLQGCLDYNHLRNPEALENDFYTPISFTTETLEQFQQLLEGEFETVGASAAKENRM